MKTDVLGRAGGGKYYVKNDVKSLVVWANRTNFAARKFNQTNW